MSHDMICTRIDNINSKSLRGNLTLLLLRTDVDYAFGKGDKLIEVQ